MNNECKCHEHEECICGNECECHNNEQKESKKIKKDKLKNEINKLIEINKKLEQDVLMAKADLINYRKRKDEEISRMLKYANEDFAKELLVTIDNFERAISMDDKNLDDEVSKFLAGVKMIYCGLINTFEKYEIRAIDGINKQFEPTYHQAVMTEKRDGVEPGIVIEVLQKGYLLKDKVIRPAMVRVSE